MKLTGPYQPREHVNGGWYITRTDDDGTVHWLLPSGKYAPFHTEREAARACQSWNQARAEGRVLRPGGKRRRRNPDPPYMLPGERIVGEITVGRAHQRAIPRILGEIPEHLRPPEKSFEELQEQYERATKGGKRRHAPARKRKVKRRHTARAHGKTSLTALARAVQDLLQ